MSAPQIKSLEIGTLFRPNPVLEQGSGKPMVYLHGAFGPEWTPFLDTLAQTRRVIAPANVGTTDLDELTHMDGILDLMLYYDEVFDRLGLEGFDLIGHSFGGMVAAEYAALFPRRVSKLVLIDPLGLWRDDQPVLDYNYMPREEQAVVMYADATSPAVQAVFAQVPQDPMEQVKWGMDRMIALGATNHFLWPIPERGLHKRLRRIKSPTLLLWGAKDRIVPPVYGKDFAARIAGAKLQVIDNAGHAPHVEQPAAVATAVSAFIG